MDIIDFEKSIMTLDRGYVSLELMAWLNELNLYFVQRLKSNTYKAEVNQIKDCDSPINIKLNSSRLRGFKDPELKEKYSKELYLKLRLVTVELENGQKERLLTNIPPKIMTTDQNIPHLRRQMDYRNQLQHSKKPTRNRKLHIQYKRKHQTRRLLNSTKLQYLHGLL